MRELAPKEIDLLQRIIDRPELQPFFFKKAKGIHWLIPLYERGFFSPEKNPRPVKDEEEGYVTIQNWYSIDYLVENSHELRQKNNAEYAKLVIAIIRDTTEHAKLSGYSNYRTWWQFSKILCELPFEIIEDSDVDLLEYWLDDPYDRGLVAEQIGLKLLPALVIENEQCKNIALAMLSAILSLRTVSKDDKSGAKEVTFRFDIWHANKVIEKIAKLFGEIAHLDAALIFETCLKSALKEIEKDAWSHIWRKAIEEHPQNQTQNNLIDVAIKGFRECLLGLVEKHNDISRDYLLSLLSSEFNIIKRIVIYVVDVQFSRISILLDLLISKQFFSSNFQHELWNLIKNNYMSFSNKQRNKIITIIESIVIYDDNVEIELVPTAYRRSIWFSAIKGFSDELFEKYNKCIEVTGHDPEHPDFSSYMTLNRGSDESLVSIETMQSLKQSLRLSELVDLLNSFEDVDVFKGPNLRGLVKSFNEFIKTSATDLYLYFDEISQLKIEFIYEIFEAYKELWNKNMELPWNNVWHYVFNFCLSIVSDNNFWNEINSRERNNFVANRHWIVGSIAELIKSGVQSDDHAFDYSLMPEALAIILIMLDKQKGNDFSIEFDAISTSINSPRGKCIEALINHTLRTCRYDDRKEGDHEIAWNEYESIYDNEFDRSIKGEYEFLTLMSNYIPNFLYMSKPWILKKMPLMFDKSNYLQWNCCMQGFAYISRFHFELHDYLKLNGDYIKALDDENMKNKVCERIIQYTVVAYINNFEKIDDDNNFISTILSRANLEELLQLIWFFWTLREEGNIKLMPKINELWPRLLKIYDENSKEWKKIASSLCHWSSFIDVIDESNKEWLLKIAPFSNIDHNSYILLENLARMSKTQPFEAQEVWLKMLTNYSYDYPEESIKDFFSNLIDKGPEGKRKAIEISDAYIRHGTERPRLWLMEVIEKKLT